jgi:hypothetical protein
VERVPRAGLDVDPKDIDVKASGAAGQSFMVTVTFPEERWERPGPSWRRHGSERNRKNAQPSARCSSHATTSGPLSNASEVMRDEHQGQSRG